MDSLSCGNRSAKPADANGGVRFALQVGVAALPVLLAIPHGNLLILGGLSEVVLRDAVNHES